MAAFDHFIYGGRDLDAMRSAFAALSGVDAGLGGRHPGLGTRNALASLGEGVYLELLATDPEQALQRNMGARLAGFAQPRLFAYMLRRSDLEAAQAVLERHRIGSDLFDASRTTPEGATLRWRLLVPRENTFGDFVPKFIDWLDTPHPSGSSTRGCRFESFEMGHPQARQIEALLHDLGADLPVQYADRPYMHLKIATPRGSLVLGGHD